MTRNKQTKRTVIAAGAWMGWAAAVGITLAAPFTEIAQLYPFFWHRMFAICLVGALALTVAWLIERARRPAIPVSASVETGFNLGVEAGKEMARMEASLNWSGPCRRCLMGDQIMDGEGRDTSPFRRL